MRFGSYDNFALRQKYILGDYTKFERSSLFKICDWSEITALITNDHADKGDCRSRKIRQ